MYQIHFLLCICGVSEAFHTSSPLGSIAPMPTARRASSLMDITGVNGELPIENNINATSSKYNPSPPLTFEKFMTMQDKRVLVTVRYSGDSGLKPYYLTVAKKLKLSHPDVVIEKRILPAKTDPEDPTFEILVDSKVVVGKASTQVQSLDTSNEDMTGGLSVFVSMQELDLAISKARRRRRPSTLYGEPNGPNPDQAIRLDMLRNGSEEDNGKD